MNKAFRFVLAAWCTLIFCAPMLAEPALEPRTQAPSGDRTDDAGGWNTADLNHLWDEVKTLVRRGAYQEALKSLDRILAETPNDPQAKLYQELCRSRLESPGSFPQLPPSELSAIKERLRQEEHGQRGTGAQLKVVEQQVKWEQARWDQELATFERQAKLDEELKRRQTQTEAVERARTERVRRREVAQQQAVRRVEHTRPRSTNVAGQTRKPAAQAPEATAPQQPTSSEAPTEPETYESAAPPTPTPGELPSSTPETSLEPAPVSREAEPAPHPAASVREPERVSVVAKPGPSGAVELSPVVVPGAPSPAPGGAAVSPSLAAAHVRLPQGAVQINANQMSVSPERRLAVAEGNVEVVFGNALLTCDHLSLFTDTKDAYAEGRVRLEEGDQVFRGEMVHYNFENKKGRFLQGTVSTPPWHQHGRSVEHLAERIYQVTPGYITSCELEPPHFRFSGRQAIVFADDKLVRAQNVALFVEQLPFLYFPWLTVADRRTPFFIIPGKKKPWEQYALMGYRYELPIEGEHKGTLRLDWRRTFGWGMGADHQFNSDKLGKGLLKVYYNEEPYSRAIDPKATLPKGAAFQRYRLLWRHYWEPLEDTTVITDLQEYSDINYRKDFLFREEFVNDDQPESFISLVKSAPAFTVTGLVRKRMNRFQTVNEVRPQLTFDVREQRIGDTDVFSQTRFDFANFETKRVHSDNDTDVVRADWFQQLSYALNLFRPILVTPNVGVRQTYYTKDIQSGTTALLQPSTDRKQGRRDLLSGQFSAGVDASLKLFKVFPVAQTDWLGLNLDMLRHVLTPTLSYAYVRPPTVSNELLTFAAAGSPSSQLTFGLNNKLQTRRAVRGKEKLQKVDLSRFLVSLPYAFRGSGNKQGGRIGNWSFDLETYPWPWMRLESDWVVPSHFVAGTRDARIQQWNVDLVLVGGEGELDAQRAPDIQAPEIRPYESGPKGGAFLLMPQGQWYLGLSHRYSQNDKTESLLQYDWRLSDKWQIGTFHRMTWKEVVGSSKRFNDLREYQYSLRRDLHDWLAELVYRVDREYGEEIFFTLTLKAYPELPITMDTSYHQPKIGSQSSPFSPLATNR